MKLYSAGMGIALASSCIALTNFVFTANNREALFQATPNYL